MNRSSVLIDGLDKDIEEAKDRLYAVPRHRTASRSYYDLYVIKGDIWIGPVLRRVTNVVCMAIGSEYDARHESLVVKNPGYGHANHLSELFSDRFGREIYVEVL